MSRIQEELNKKGRFRYRRNRLYRAGFFTRCVAGDTFNVLLLRAELDDGEAEALIQARAIATRMGRTDEDTLRLLARFNLERGGRQVSGLVRVLRRELDSRVSNEIVHQAIELAAERHLIISGHLQRCDPVLATV